MLVHDKDDQVREAGTDTSSAPIYEMNAIVHSEGDQSEDEGMYEMDIITHNKESIANRALPEEENLNLGKTSTLKRKWRRSTDE